MRRLILRAMQIYKEGYVAWYNLHHNEKDPLLNYGYAMRLLYEKQRWDHLPKAIREIAHGLIKKGYRV